MAIGISGSIGVGDSLRPSVSEVFRDPWLLLATGFGSGLAPRAPGTFGTLVALPIYAMVFSLPWPAYLGLVIFGFLAGVVICARAEQTLNAHDPSCLVWDEIIGYLVTMLPVVFGWVSGSFFALAAAGFVLFRIFDIAKPWPVKMLDQRVLGGLGTMADDIAAGIYAALVLGVAGSWLFA
ncbi:MAG: phosphatidylglycerophosphatase A [Pseudomonadota bacterium]|nr:phosphatidylglycerophosphatase A [Pseudomonadota bacterium]